MNVCMVHSRCYDFLHISNLQRLSYLISAPIVISSARGYQPIPERLSPLYYGSLLGHRCLVVFIVSRMDTITDTYY